MVSPFCQAYVSALSPGKFGITRKTTSKTPFRFVEVNSGGNRASEGSALEHKNAKLSGELEFIRDSFGIQSSKVKWHY